MQGNQFKCIFFIQQIVKPGNVQFTTIYETVVVVVVVVVVVAYYAVTLRSCTNTI